MTGNRGAYDWQGSNKDEPWRTLRKRLSFVEAHRIETSGTDYTSTLSKFWETVIVSPSAICLLTDHIIFSRLAVVILQTRPGCFLDALSDHLNLI